MTILLVEQRALHTVALADRTHVLVAGKLHLTLNPADAKRSRQDRGRLPRLMILAAVNFQTLSDAVGLGAIYALMAVGIGLVFGVLRLVNFAYGQLVMAGAYTLAFTSSWPRAAEHRGLLRGRRCALARDGGHGLPAFARPVARRDARDHLRDLRSCCRRSR